MINKEVFNKLKTIDGQLCVSLYVPMEVTGDYEKNRIKWKNACQEAVNKLESEHNNSGEFMKPALDLIDNTDFWAYQRPCLAGFYSEGYNETIQMPRANMEVVSVGNNFFTSPLISEITNKERIFILAVSKNETRFFEAVPDGIYPVKISDVVVDNIDEAINVDDPTVSTQHHSAGGKAIFHANGPGTDMDDVRLKQYLRRIDDGLMEIIHDERVPLVLACVEEYYPVYKEVTKYKYLSQHMVVGNPENLSPAELREQIQPVFLEIRQNDIKEVVNNYGIKKGENLAMNNLKDIAVAADHKNVEQILINRNYIDSLSAEDKEKIDDVIMNVYDSGGDVFLTNDQECECHTLMATQRFSIEKAS